MSGPSVAASLRRSRREPLRIDMGAPAALRSDALPKVVCLTPVRNERWILEVFLTSTSQWADHIIVADQGSTDGSREIATRFPKVTLVSNDTSDAYDEASRTRLLLKAARRIPGPLVLVALDADELLPRGLQTSEEWRAALRAEPGTVLEFPRVELYRDTDKYFRHSVEDAAQWFAFGYVDDGAPHEGRRIHSVRVPTPESAPRLRLPSAAVLHHQFVHWGRMESKHRWYRCWERLQFPGKTATEINSLYDWMNRGHPNVRPLDPHWHVDYPNGWAEAIKRERSGFWWDWEVLRMFATHGTSPFAALDIWSVDWESLRRAGLEAGVSGLPATPVVPPNSLRQRLARRLASASDAPLRRVRGRLAQWLVA
jgi:glycosyltransferase involved in cell wall biosynthesis